MPLSRTLLISISCLLSLLIGGCAESPEDLFAQAEQHANERQYRTAIVELKALLQETPEDMRARWLLGNIYLDIRDGASAEKELLHAQSSGMNDDTVVPLLAQALLMQGKVEEVLALQTAESLSLKSKAELEASRALAYLAQRELDKAQARIDAAVASDSKSTWVRMAQAELLFAGSKFEEAESIVDSIVASEPSNGRAWHLLGHIRFATKRYSEAEDAYSQAIQHQFVSTLERMRRGFARVAQNDVKGASKDADTLLKQAPDAWSVQYYVGLVRYLEKRYNEALEVLEKRYASDPRDLRTRFLLAATHAQLGHAARAQTLAESVVSAAPGFVPGRLLLASLKLQQRNGAEAEELLRPIVEAIPEHLQAKQALASSLVLQRKLEEATGLFEEIASQRTDQPSAHLRAGIGLLSLGKDGKALTALGEAVRLAPGDRQINATVVTGLLGGKRIKEALETAEEYSRQQPDDPVTWTLLGTAYVADNQTEEAKKAFEKALELDPDNPVAFQNLASLAAREKDPATARRYLERGLAKNPDHARMLYLLAALELSEKNVERTQQLLERAVNAQPSYLEPRIALARLMITQNHAEQALLLLSDIPRDRYPTALLTRAQAYAAQDRFEDAKPALEALRTLKPDLPQVHFALVHVYAELGDKEGLNASLDRAAALAPENPAVVLAKVRLLTLDKRFDEADALLASLKKQPDETSVLFTKLFLERKRGDVAAEVKVARQLFAEKPTSRTVLALTTAMLKAGKPDEAESQLITWLAQYPKDAGALWMLSQIYIRQGKTTDVVQSLQRLIALAPDHKAAHNNLAWYLRETDPGQALVHAKRAYELAPESPAILDTYAETLARSGQAEQALKMIDAAIAETGDAVVLRLRRAEILYLLGDHQRAIHEAEALVADEAPEAIKKRARQLTDKWRG